MRVPTSWKDKGLLEDDPFASVFLVRKESGYRSRRSDDWIPRLGQEIKSNPNLRTAAAHWLQDAFAPEGEARSPNGSTSTISNNLPIALIEVFVHFYWTWYAHGEDAALKIVNDERKKRRLDYRLPGMQPEGLGQDEPAPSQPGHRPKRGRNRRTLNANRRGRGSAASASAAADLDATASHESLAPRGDDASTADALVNVSPQPRSPDAAACAFSTCDSTTPNEVINAITLVVAAEDADTLMEADPTLVIVDTSRDVAIVDEEPLHDARSRCISPPHAAESLVSSSGRSSITAVGGAAEDPQPTAPPGRPPRKKAAANIPVEFLRRGPPRNAANPERLSLLMKSDLAYKERAKRGVVDDLEGLFPTDGAQEGNMNARRVSKKSKMRQPAPEEGDPMDSSTGIHDPGPSNSAAAAINALPHSGGTGVLALKKPKRVGSFKKIKKAKAKVRHQLASTSVIARPAKRRRRDGPAVNLRISLLNHDMVQKSGHENSTLIPSPSGADSVGRSAEPVGVPQQPTSATNNGRSRTANPRKRPRATILSEKDAHDAERAVPGNRKIAKLPKRKSNSKRLVNGTPPAPSALSLGIPANLPEADKMVKSFATEALMVLHNTTPAAEGWPDDTGAQDDPPDSDDEEDIPLSARSSRWIHGEPELDRPNCRVVSTNGTRVAYETDPELRTPAGPPASVSHTNPLGNDSRNGPSASSRIHRVPRPILPYVPPKRPLTAQPIIWAKSRQEVCESFEWFRSYQAGVYFNGGLAKGYLLSAFSASRDIFARGGRLIVSHGGGKAESLHSNKGNSHLLKADDQREGDKSVRALLQTYEKKCPLVLIIDDRYALFPYDLSTKKDCTYVVLGFYHIAHAWAERQPANNERGYVVRYKFAFEWCDKQPTPWWIEKDAGLLTTPEQDGVPPEPADENVHALDHVCPHCSKPSPLIYEARWMCLQPNCPAFWTLSDGQPPPEDLTYAESFLKAPLKCDHEMLDDISPQTPATESTDGITTSRRFAKGWHCKDCGRLSCRFHWQHWECRNCQATLQIISKNRSPQDFWCEMSDQYGFHKVAEDSDIQVSETKPFRAGDHFGQYRIYALPENRGNIYLILGNPLINTVADEIFEKYQEQAKTDELQFRRWPLRSHRCRGELLTNYFSQNTGEPYQYVGGTNNTVPFDTAPSAVVKARDLIQSRMMNAFVAEREPYRFNEVLSAGYMEQQKMAFHSDSENGLGPRVASLSLGSCAHMHFRLQNKYREGTGGGAKRNVLTLFLRHGDVLIMDGADVQNFYEHTVIPLNFRIAATARYIDNRTH